MQLSLLLRVQSAVLKPPNKTWPFAVGQGAASRRCCEEQTDRALDPGQFLPRDK